MSQSSTSSCADEGPLAPRKDTVLVTGSSGCLGQHIVKLLQERCDNVAEIRLFDVKNYKNKLRHSMDKKMVHFLGDIRNPKLIDRAMEGVACVIHCAAVIDLNVVPDVKHMNSVNIDGTQAVIDACIANNVPRLIFASTTSMVCGTEHIFYGTESTTPIPKSFMIGKYGESKWKAEELVLKANATLCRDHRTILRTCSLRPTPFFGERDKHLFIRFMVVTEQTRGFYYKVRSLDERLQISYVGNVAWAFVKAAEKLAVDPYIGGEAFFITDDTPIIDIHEHVSPYLTARGFKISQYNIPYWLAWIFLSLICFWIRFMNTFIKPIYWNVPSVQVLNYMCSTFFYNRSKATLRLDYEPIYTPSEVKWRSLEYYDKVKIRRLKGL